MLQYSMETMQNPMEPLEKLAHYKPSIIVLSCPPLTGKTTLANRIATGTNLSIIDVDEIRGEIDETRKLDPSQRRLPPEQELAIMVRSYTLLCYVKKLWREQKLDNLP